MSYCVHCGAKLREGVNFCEACGAEVSHVDETIASDADEELVGEDEPEVEDCDETPEKGPPTDCYATFEGRCVSIYRVSGAIYRRIYLNHNVLSAQIMGDNVSITCEGGWCFIYTLDGVLVRQMRH